MRPGDVVGQDRGQSVIDAGICPEVGCEIHVYLIAASYAKLRDSHKSFYCHSGHGQAFTGLSPLETAAADATKRAEAAELAAERARQAALKVERQCPWPTCDGRLLSSPRGLRQHMVKTHGAPWAVPEVSAEEVGQVLNGRDPASVVR